MLSDHSPVILSLDEKPENKRGRGIWKLNNSLLDTEGFEEGVTLAINNTLVENRDANPHLLWEFVKYEARKFCIKFSKQRSKNNNFDKRKHEAIVAQFESNPSENITSQEDYDDSKQWLENWYDEYTKGAILRSKAEWYEQGEKSTKFFLNLEKRNSVKNTIRNLYIADNIICDDESKILNHSKRFYENLFTRKSDKSLDACSVFLSNIDTPSLSLTQKESCDTLLDINELKYSLDSMSSDKTPGNDGLTVEFYKKFWHILKDPLFSSVTFSKERGALSISQRQAIIKLLEKNDKDKRYIENWRPISLLSVDTKIISKAIANRLKNVLPDIISHDQTAYVKGRFIGESTRLISDILEVTNQYNISGYILTADIEKAFDSMDHSFLIACLRKFGFGNYFIDWVKVLLNKNESCVINGGTTSTYFNLQRGARQGDPIAAYLFIITLEMFFIAVRSDDRINKLNIFDHNFILSAYADDTTFFVKDLESVKVIFLLFDDFSSFSGFKLNLSKCEICGIGALKGDVTALCNIKNINLLTESIKVLGIHFSYDINLCHDKNFISTVRKIEGVLKVWKMRHLTLNGKIIIFKTLAISKIVFVSYITSMPDCILRHLNNIHKKIIWDGKKAKIKHSTLIGKYDEGGLKDVDIETKIKALQLSWVRRLHDNNFHPWKIIPMRLLSKYSTLGKNLFYPNFNYVPNNIKIPVFYKNILIFWSEFSSANPLTASSILSESIWNNILIKINNCTISPSFLTVDKHIFIADFFDIQGNVVPWNQFKVLHNIQQYHYFRWMQILDAFPNTWKLIIKNDGGKSRIFCDFRPHMLTNAKIYPLDKLTSKELYNIHLKVKFRLPTSHKSIQHSLKNDLIPWKKVYILSRNISIDSYSRIFQYKVLNNILFLNNSLFKMGKVDSPLCSYCREDNETIAHLFLDCHVSKSIWLYLTNFFGPRLTIPTLDLQSAVLGFLDSSENNLILNNILLMYKITLYRNRGKNIITAQHVLKNLQNREKIEKSIALNKYNKIDYHNNKWNLFLNIIR